MVVTRTEIAEHIQGAFAGDKALSAGELLVSAERSGARAEVLRTLERLPGTYTNLRELWPDLPGVPVGS